MPPQIILNRSQFNFGSDKDGHRTPAQVLRIEISAGEILKWKASTQSPWINIEASSGTGPAVVGISVNPTGLPPGTHRGAITIEDPIAVNSPQSVNVTLTVFNTGGAAPPLPHAGGPFCSAIKQDCK